MKVKWVIWKEKKIKCNKKKKPNSISNFSISLYRQASYINIGK